MMTTSVQLPKLWIDWVEQEALRRKQHGLQSRAGKSPVVLEALKLLRERLERERGQEQEVHRNIRKTDRP
jgi:hypothetical protein